MESLISWLPFLGGVIMGAAPAVYTAGRYRQKTEEKLMQHDRRLSEHVTADNKAFESIEERMREGSREMGKIKDILIEMRTDIKWLKGEGEGG